ncbi:MAG: leucine-rich repeat domain-containing protein [Lachnospiraceae bacterium]|nr:leucine-rich repeat domain-containing protein [Lachnospiraceae bacterium]
MGRRERKWKRRLLVMLAALALCLTGILGWPGFGMTAQAGKTPVSSAFVFKVTVTGGKGVAVSDPEQPVDSKLYDTSFNCLSGQYVKLYYKTDPAPDFQKFDHWHVNVGIQVSSRSLSEEYFYEEDLTDFIVYPELQKFTEEEQENIIRALKLSDVTIKGKVKIQAQYVDNYWLVDFDTNGAEGEMEAVKVEKGQSYELPECPIAIEGHDFTGWKLGEEVYQPGESVEITEDVTLEAQWKLRTYSVTVSTNAPDHWVSITGGGTYGYGTEATVTATGKTYQNTEYGLLHWKDRDTDEIVSREPSYSFIVTGKRSLLATIAPYTTMDFSAGGGQGTMERAKVLVGEQYVLPECEFTKPGWRFAGWAIRNYDGVYPAGETFTVAYQHFLTATWEEIPELAVPIDEEHFPDSAFRNYLKFTTSINKNGDEWLTSSELAIPNLTLQSQSIETLKGIEYFTELTSLYCNGSKITELDLTNSKKLKTIEIKNTTLSTIKLDGLTELVTLSLDSNELTSLELPEAPSLKTIKCNYNKLTSLSVHDFPALESLSCSNNSVLETLTLNNLPALKTLGCQKNKLKSLDVTGFPALTSLACGVNEIESLDVSKNSLLVSLSCEDNKLQSLDITENKALKALWCSNNQLESLDPSQNKNLEQLYCGSNPIKDLYVVGLTKLKTFDCLWCEDLDSLTLDELPALTTAKVTTLASIGNVTLGKTAFSSFACKAIHLDVSKAVQLKELECSNAGLETLTLGSNTAMTWLYLMNNHLSEFDLSGLTALTYLCVTGNDVKQLDISNNTKLEAVYCEKNQIRNLDLTNNPKISALDCTTNLITALDVSKNPEIRDYRGTRLRCDNDVVLYTGATEHCQISVSASPAEGGKAYGSGSWIQGAKVSLVAEAEEGYEFQCWMEGIEVVSEDAVYEFTGAEDRVLTAVFAEDSYDANLFIDKKSLTLYDTIAIDFKVPVAALEGYHDPYLLVTQNEVTDVISDSKIVGAYCIFTYRVAPHQMGDLVTAVPAALNAEEKEILGVPMEYSVAQYCQNMLNKEDYQIDAYATFRRLLVDILLYGDAAQSYVGYKTDSPVSGFLTAEQRAMGTDVSITMTYETVKEKLFATVEEEDELASIETAALYLEAAVNIQFKYLANDLTDLRVVVTDDEAGTNVIGECPADASLIDNKGRYYVTFGNLNAAQMRKTVYATVMKGDQKVSNTYRYSIESYAESVKGKHGEALDNLLDAMMRYGDSAASFAGTN